MIVAAIPACNEEKTVAKVVIGAQRHVDKVLVVDDGSSDATAEIAERLGAVGGMMLPLQLERLAFVRPYSIARMYGSYGFFRSAARLPFGVSVRSVRLGGTE